VYYCVKSLLRICYLSASQWIYLVVWNMKVHYRIHKSTPFAPLLSQMNSVRSSHSVSLRPTLILSFYLRMGLGSGLSASFRFSYQNCVCIFTVPSRYNMLRLFHLVTSCVVWTFNHKASLCEIFVILFLLPVLPRFSHVPQHPLPNNSRVIKRTVWCKNCWSFYFSNLVVTWPSHSICL
jgi:hypothetical protein